MARASPNSFLSRIPAKENWPKLPKPCLQLNHYAAFYSWWLETTKPEFVSGTSWLAIIQFDAGSVIGLTLHWHYMHISKQSYFIFRKTNWHQICAVVLSGTSYEALQQPPWEIMTALWKGLIVKGLGKVKRRYRIIFSEIQETGSMMKLINRLASDFRIAESLKYT